MLAGNGDSDMVNSFHNSCITRKGWDIEILMDWFYIMNDLHIASLYYLVRDGGLTMRWRAIPFSYSFHADSELPRASLSTSRPRLKSHVFIKLRTCNKQLRTCPQDGKPSEASVTLSHYLYVSLYHLNQKTLACSHDWTETIDFFNHCLLRTIWNRSSIL